MEQYANPEVKPAENIEVKADDSKVSPTNNQSQEEVSTPKTFTQEEFNDAMAAVRKKTESNVLKKLNVLLTVAKLTFSPLAN